MFVDRVKLSLVAGRGGNGVVAWRREKYIPKGGPAGGDGGNGGSVIIRTEKNLLSLEHYRHKRQLKADCGAQGGANLRHGKTGKDLILKIPVGTILRDTQTGEIVHDFTEENEEILICRGGRGGKGNVHFKSSTNRAPNQFTEGTYGQKREIELELKLIADIGFVGFPNAGKSTLMSKVSRVDVKIAPYPFTTLQPNLSYIEFDDFSRVLIADIPGIIKDAHQNKGLGFEFLKHIERTEVLLFMIDLSGIDERDPLDDYAVLRNEISQYNQTMAEKPFLIALNKIDTEKATENLSRFYEKYPELRDKCFEISALESQGLDALIENLRIVAQSKSIHY